MASDKHLSVVLAHLVAAISNCSMYSAEHPAVEEFLGKVLADLENLFVEDSLSLTLLSDSFLHNDTPLSDTGAHISRFIKRLKAKGIERLIFQRGVSPQEMKDFIASLASREGTVTSSPHITVGMLEVRYKTGGDITTIMNESVAKVKEIYSEVSRFSKLDMRGIEDVVMGFINVLEQEANVLRSLSPIKEHSPYTYVHETNVSVLTIFQAEALGITGEALHEAGLAGLLHDVGKLFVPKEIIEKAAKLNEHEWGVMQLHPVYGALYLSTQSDISKITIIAAYEHHMRYDGSGYPQNKKTIKSQHMISQLVAIADFFDAMRTKRSYRSSFNLFEVLKFIKEGTGTYFNPDLVDNFLRAFQKVRAI